MLKLHWQLDLTLIIFMQAYKELITPELHHSNAVARITGCVAFDTIGEELEEVHARVNAVRLECEEVHFAIDIRRVTLQLEMFVDEIIEVIFTGLQSLWRTDDQTHVHTVRLKYFAVICCCGICITFGMCDFTNLQACEFVNL